MRAGTKMVHPVDPDGKPMYRAGGISALVIAVAYIMTVVLYADVGAPPSSGEAWLKYAAGKTTAWWAIAGLSVLTDVLFVLVALALYLALKGIGRNTALIATALVGLFVVLDLAVTWTNYASLISLSSEYVAATSEAQRASYVAAAEYAAGVLSSHLEVVYAIVILSFAILLFGLVMLKGIFGRTTAYLALLTGRSGIAAVADVSVIIVVNALLATIWVVFVGLSLYRLSRQ